MIHILDYSWARPNLAEVRQFPDGPEYTVGIMRYVGPGNGGRDITRAEMESAWANDLGVGLVYQTTTNASLGGFEAGKQQAREAQKWADKLGWPHTKAIYFTCDMDVSTSQARGVVCEFFRGTMCAPFPTRAYGEADVLDAVHDALGMRHGWQPASTAWSGGRVSGHAGMLQRWPYVMNDQCDDNHVLCPSDQIDWLWNGGSDDMPLTQDDLNQIKGIVDSSINSAMSKAYTGRRILQAQGDPGVFEVVDRGDDDLARRWISSPDKIGFRQYVDWAAGARGDGPRVLTDPADIAYFNSLPVVNPQADGYAEYCSERERA